MAPLIIFILTILLFIFVIGLVIGSFLNVVIIRALSNESIVFPGSKCPSCQAPLKWYHNIPVLSYLFLKGKCAFCSDKISIQYPIVELVTGFMFVAVFIKYGLTLQGLFMLVFASLFIVLAATDIKEKIVFDFHTYTLVIVGLIYNFLSVNKLYPGDHVLFSIGQMPVAINNSLIASLLGIILGVVVMEVFARFGYLIAGTRAFGEGDTYIAAGLGAVFGWYYLLTVLLYAFIVQIFLTVPVFVKKLYDKKDYKTLGAFLGFLLIVFVMKWFEYEDFTSNAIIFTIMALLLASIGIYLCFRIIKGLKTKENMTYLPFGPALVIGGFIAMFITSVN